MSFLMSLWVGTAQGQSFHDTLPIPPLASGTDFYLRPHNSVHSYSSDPADTLINVPAMGYDVTVNGQTYSMDYLGPTLHWRKGDSVRIDVYNDLQGMMGMMEETTVHWHGMHVPAKWDGGPGSPIPQHTTWSPRFKILNGSSTLWYHPHLHHMTFRQVSLGLAGMIRITDPNEPLDTLLPHTYGIDDIPLVLQDKYFEYDASIGTDTVSTYVHVTDSGTVTTSGFFPTTFVVNGILNPRGKLPKQMVRLRMLSGARTVSFNLVLTQNNDSTTQRVPFQVVTADQGYLDSAYTRQTILLSPGERWEIVVDLSNFDVGDSLTLWTAASEITGGIDGGPNPFGGPLAGRNVRLARFEVVAPTTATPAITSIPSVLAPLYTYTGNVSQHRRKVLSGDFPYMPMIDSLPFDENVINDIVLLDSTEIWTIRNVSNEAHPFHLHDVFFTLLDTSGQAINAGIYKGMKDVVIVPAHDSISFKAYFPDFADSVWKYMYHCHILAHEDQGMMHQFIVWDANWGPLASRPGPATPSAGWTIYPNPADGQLWLRGSSTKASDLRIFDLQGKELRHTALRPFEGDIALDIDHLAKGMYLMVWETAAGTETKKFVLR